MSSAHAAKRARARKLRKSLGPFQTSCATFDRGPREIEIVRLTPDAITYRLKGRTHEYTLGHDAAYLRAVSNASGFDTRPRESTQIKRGSV